MSSDATTESLPFFAPAGRPTALFSVVPGLSTADALEAASSFLSGAIGLAVENTAAPNENRQWAVVYLAEMARALVDSARAAGGES